MKVNVLGHRYLRISSTWNLLRINDIKTCTIMEGEIMDER